MTAEKLITPVTPSNGFSATRIRELRAEAIHRGDPQSSVDLHPRCTEHFTQVDHRTAPMLNQLTARVLGGSARVLALICITAFEIVRNTRQSRPVGGSG
jgi:hypothetical protein